MDYATPAHERDEVCELVTAACEIVERYARLGHRDERAAAEVAVAHADLTDRAAGIADPELAGDVDGAAAELAELAGRLEVLPPPVPALTG